jgi:molybdate transport system permease protein
VLALSVGAVAAAFFLLPVAGLAWRAPWSSIWSDLTDPTARTALRLSLTCSLWATVVALTAGIPLAWVLARVEVPGRRLLRALVLVPLVLPPVVGGVALLLAFGRRGLLGQYLDSWFGITLPFTTAGAVLAWARALGEFGATITFAGNTPHRTTTIPLQVYLLLESGHLESAIALSLVLLAVSIAVLALLRDRWTTAL